MFSSSTPLFADNFLLHSTNIRASERLKTSQKKVKLKAHDNFTCIAHSSTPSTLSSFSTAALHKSIPLAASIAILLWSNPGTPLVNSLFSMKTISSLASVSRTMEMGLFWFVISVISYVQMGIVVFCDKIVGAIHLVGHWAWIREFFELNSGATFRIQTIPTIPSVV